MPNCPMVPITVLVGGMVVLQTDSNASFGYLLGHSLGTSLTSLGVSLGTVYLGLPLVWVPLSVSAGFGGASWWDWFGGLLGAAYPAVAILVAPHLDAATFIACVVTGQMLVSTPYNQFGQAGLPARRLSREGYLGLVLVVVGALLLQQRGRM